MVRSLLLLLVAGCSTTAVERWDEIQGEEWLLQKIEGSPAVAGTEISLTFGTGRLYGRAVNRYAAPYVRTDDVLKIEPAGATRKFLDEPPGAMEQEARYLKLLAQADGWQLGGGWLELQRGGKTLLAFKLRGSTSRS
jgi:heat shock protein HslJ